MLEVRIGTSSWDKYEGRDGMGAIVGSEMLVMFCFLTGMMVIWCVKSVIIYQVYIHDLCTLSMLSQ